MTTNNNRRMLVAEGKYTRLIMSINPARIHITMFFTFFTFLIPFIIWFVMGYIIAYTAEDVEHFAGICKEINFHAFVGRPAPRPPRKAHA